MANSTLSALSAATTLAGAELVYGVQSGGDVKVTAQQIQNFLLGTAYVGNVVLDGPSSWAYSDVNLTLNKAQNSQSAIAVVDMSTTGSLGHWFYALNNIGSPAVPQLATYIDASGIYTRN